MVRNPDHVTVVVTDVEASIAFFALLGFKVEEDQVISGPVMDAYLRIPNLEARHVTLVLEGCTPHFDIQLLNYLRPAALDDPYIRDLNELGYNHLCFRVDDIDAEVARLKAAGVTFRSEIMEFRHLKLAFLEGPEGITLELAEHIA